MGDHAVDKTVLFADIAGSTRLYTERGDDATRKLLGDCLDLMETIVKARKGTVSRRIGDELLCTFDKPDDAALAAIDLQTKVSAGFEGGLFPCPMRLRAGFVHGPIIEAPDALYGTHVHTAARVASLAKAGQTLTTKATIGLLNPALRCFTRYFDHAVLKGQNGEQEIHELMWRVPKATIPRRQPSAPRPAPDNYVELEQDGCVFRVDANRSRIEIGRDRSCDICFEDASSVSHVHARVFWDHGQINLEDVSTNGTVIARDNHWERTIHHARATLRGRGSLVLGDEEDAATLDYRCGLGGI